MKFYKLFLSIRFFSSRIYRKYRTEQVYAVLPVITVCFLLLLNSCQLPYRAAKQPRVRPVPVSFSGTTDSASISNQTWSTFFADSNLVQLIDTALVRNLDLQIATQRIETARQAYNYSQGFLHPQINLAASAGLDRYGRVTQSGIGNYDLNFSQNITPSEVIPNPTPDFFWVPAAVGKLTSGANCATAEKRLMFGSWPLRRGVTRLLRRWWPK